MRPLDTYHFACYLVKNLAVHRETTTGCLSGPIGLAETSCHHFELLVVDVAVAGVVVVVQAVAFGSVGSQGLANSLTANFGQDSWSWWRHCLPLQAYSTQQTDQPDRAKNEGQ